MIPTYEKTLGLRFWEWRTRRAIRRAERLWRKVSPRGYIKIYTGIPSIDEANESPTTPGQMPANPKRKDR